MASESERVAVPVMGQVEDIDMLRNRHVSHEMLKPFSLIGPMHLLAMAHSTAPGVTDTSG
jgi:hypothetical protein